MAFKSQTSRVKSPGTRFTPFSQERDFSKSFQERGSDVDLFKHLVGIVNHRKSIGCFDLSKKISCDRSTLVARCFVLWREKSTHRDVTKLRCGSLPSREKVLLVFLFHPRRCVMACSRFRKFSLGSMICTALVVALVPRAN